MKVELLMTRGASTQFHRVRYMLASLTNSGYMTIFKNCDEKNVNVSKGSDYQVRLKIFQETNENHLDGLKMPYGAIYECHVNTFWRPENFESMWGKVKTRYSYNTKECYKTENLRECSRCRIALYCSAECQHKHWPEHKRICKQLAKLRKDKTDSRNGKVKNFLKILKKYQLFPRHFCRNKKSVRST